MKKTNYLGLVLSAVLVSSMAFGAVAADNKIGTVDMQKALQAVEAGKKAKGSLEKEFNVRKAQLQTEEANFKKSAEEFKKQSLVMTDEARAKKQAELQEKYMKLQEMTAKSQQDIQAKERELTEPLIEQLRGIIQEVAKTKGYTIVLEKNENSVLVSPDKDDITSDVVTEFNKKHKS